MSRIPAALIALSIVVIPGSLAVAQFVGSRSGAPTRANVGAVHEHALPVCHTSGGGTRIKANCEIALPTEEDRQLGLPLEPLVLAPDRCDVSATTEYEQRESTVLVRSTLEIPHCTAASGEFKIGLLVKDASGDVKPLVFDQTFARNDDRDVTLAAEYPIGKRTELVSVRLGGMRCTCADPLPAESSEVPSAPEAPLE